MNAGFFLIHLILAWLWIVLGFVAGFVLGLFFDREEWLGGYGSFRRRLYRLGHISLFGLGMINLMFYFTARSLYSPTPLLSVASWGFDKSRQGQAQLHQFGVLRPNAAHGNESNFHNFMISQRVDSPPVIKPRTGIRKIPRSLGQ